MLAAHRHWKEGDGRPFKTPRGFMKLPSRCNAEGMALSAIISVSLSSTRETQVSGKVQNDALIHVPEGTDPADSGP